MVTRPLVARREPDHDAHRGRLAGAVGTEEPGHPTGLADEADVVDGGEVAVLAGEAFDIDHGSRAARLGHDLVHRPRGWRVATKVGGRARPGQPAPVRVGLALSVPRWTRPDPEAYQPRLTVWGHAWRLRARCCRISAVGVAARRRRPVRAAVGCSTSRSALVALVLVFFRRRWPVPIAVIANAAERRLGDRRRPGGPGRGLGGHPPPLARDRAGRLGRLRRRAVLRGLAARQQPATRSG